MKKYRLKKEAIPFINERYATNISSFERWESIGIDINALEEVEPPHISYGINNSLCGWNAENGAQFHLTVNFPSIKWKEYDEFSKGRMVADFIRRLEDTANEYMTNFLEEVK